MRTYDFSPLWRSTIGFDRLFDLAEMAQKTVEGSYPPYNIERLATDRYRIALALAGFAPEDLKVTAEPNMLTVEGGAQDGEERTFLYRGISNQPFKHRFSLADHVQVQSASFDNGLLVIDLVREVPEAMKPRRIAIGGATSQDVGRVAKAA